jgi:hypothetical protein
LSGWKKSNPSWGNWARKIRIARALTKPAITGWGTKRICPTTGKRFYDLNKTPIISPYSGEIVDIETARRKAASVVIARPLPEKDEKKALPSNYPPGPFSFVTIGGGGQLEHYHRHRAKDPRQAVRN